MRLAGWRVRASVPMGYAYYASPISGGVASSSALFSRQTKSATRPDSTPHRSRRPHDTVISISGQTSFELTAPSMAHGPWRESWWGPSILPLSLRLTRVRSWSALRAPWPLPELVAGPELEPQRAGGKGERATERAAPTRFPRALPACPYSFFCQSLWMCDLT